MAPTARGAAGGGVAASCAHAVNGTNMTIKAAIAAALEYVDVMIETSRRTPGVRAYGQSGRRKTRRSKTRQETQPVTAGCSGTGKWMQRIPPTWPKGMR